MTILTRCDSIIYKLSTSMLQLCLLGTVLVPKGERCASFEKKLHKSLYNDLHHINVKKCYVCIFA